MNKKEAILFSLKNRDFVKEYDRLCNGKMEMLLNASPVESLVDFSSGFMAAELKKYIHFFLDTVWDRIPIEADRRE